MMSDACRTDSGVSVPRLFRRAVEFGAVDMVMCIALPCDASPLRRCGTDDSRGFLVDGYDIHPNGWSNIHGF
jgi:hypothetical protein